MRNSSHIKANLYKK